MSPDTLTAQTRPIFGNGEKANKLAATKFGGKLVSEYWEGVFRAKEEGKTVVWYNGTYIPPFFHAHDLVWVHGEAWAAMLAARHREIGAQARGDARGYDRELCSYARTHIGQMLIEMDKLKSGTSDLDPDDPRIETMLKLPAPDMIVNAYPYCSSGQQWDDITYRMFGKKVPMFTIQIPLLWGGRPDAGYMQGEEWEQRSDYVAEQLMALTDFLAEHTGRPFDFDRLSDSMSYVKRAAELRLEAMDLCTATPSPASFFDWIVSIAPVNFLPGDQNLVTYFEGVKAEIETRIANGEGAVKDEKYRLFFDGMMNWNKVGWLADKFASVNACVVAGRYTHMSFWQEPQLIDLENPVRGMAQNYLICPNNHGAPIMIGEIEKLCDKFDIDGVVCHASRTCRGMTNSQFLIAGSAKKYGRQAMFFEGDVADESFYKDELLNVRLEAMIEAIDARKRAA
ncbi:2-hydroxyacyl-CoA dehydratase subunit D [Mesobacterium pallidum]|uniref:2-hydroxyacyl-CoA dehydratase subunit D n=1 Tax=Mesobacterium pallidum TaxID=2872037 RepID=UPI001EE1CDDA|nr:2-hydroxyacyl-CoA dehydratase family protein [Mesobacterium pallidum]